MALQGLAAYCGNLNIAGLSNIEYLPTAWVDPGSYEQLVGEAWISKGTLTISVGDWLKAQVIHSSRNWNERQQRTPQGKFFSQTITAISPDLLPAVNGEFDEMADYRYLLRITDRSGQKWILGTLEQPFQFFADGASGGNGTLKSHQIRWTAQTLHRGMGLP